jgi:hypothetical protein
VTRHGATSELREAADPVGTRPLSVSETLSVPFSFNFTAHENGEVFQRVVAGVVRLEMRDLVIEHAETTTYFNPIRTERSEPAQIRVALEDVAELSLRRPWFVPPRLELRVHALDALSDYPYAGGVRCTLPLARRDRSRAEELVMNVAHRLADLELKRLEE